MGLGRNHPNLPAPSAVHVFRHPGKVSPKLTRGQIKSKIESLVKSAKIAQELRENGQVVYEIGDGRKVSTILNAIWDGYEIGNNI